MTLSESVRTVLIEKYATISGRASRSEYWFFTLFCFLVSIAFCVLFFMTADFDPYAMDADGASLGVMSKILIILFLVFSLAIIIPSICVTIRRFHDQDRSGWFFALALIPYVGTIILWVFMCFIGTDGDNRFGPDPLA